MNLVLDIDGTLANHEHRIKHLENGINEESWKKFLDPDLMLQDPPFEQAQEALKQLLKCRFKYCSINYIYIVTGRNIRHKNITEKWLKKHFNFLYKKSFVALHMRPDGEKTPATVHKETIIKKITKVPKNASPLTSFNFILIDDDPYVLNLYSKYGLALRAPDCWNIMLHPKPIEPEPLFTS